MITRPHLPLLAAIAAACAIPWSAEAQSTDGPVAAVQQSLKRQQFYAGDITGAYDDATKAAVRRFQIRQGLKVTGELDAATLESLAALERRTPEGASGNPAPNEPVPARERSRQLAQNDQEFLEKIEAEEETPPVAPSSEPSNVEPVRPPKEAQPVRRQAPTVEAPPERQTAPPAPERTTYREDALTIPPSPQSREISPMDARRFVESYLAAAEGPTPEREVSMYADRVNYFGDGRINRQAIQKDQQAYYRKWPERKFELIDEPELVRTSAEEATVRFRIKYNVSGPRDTARGRTENIVRLRRTDDGLKIVAIRERKLD